MKKTLFKLLLITGFASNLCVAFAMEANPKKRPFSDIICTFNDFERVENTPEKNNNKRFSPINSNQENSDQEDENSYLVTPKFQEMSAYKILKISGSQPNLSNQVHSFLSTIQFVTSERGTVSFMKPENDNTLDLGLNQYSDPVEVGLTLRLIALNCPNLISIDLNDIVIKDELILRHFSQLNIQKLAIIGHLGSMDFLNYFPKLTALSFISNLNGFVHLDELYKLAHLKHLKLEIKVTSDPTHDELEYYQDLSALFFSFNLENLHTLDLRDCQFSIKHGQSYKDFVELDFPELIKLYIADTAVTFRLKRSELPSLKKLRVKLDCIENLYDQDGIKDEFPDLTSLKLI